jgi:hypothetical protein
MSKSADLLPDLALGEDVVCLGRTVIPGLHGIRSVTIERIERTTFGFVGIEIDVVLTLTSLKCPR